MSKEVKTACKPFHVAKRIADGLRTAGNSVAADAYIAGYHRRNQIEFAAVNDEKKYND